MPYVRTQHYTILLPSGFQQGKIRSELEGMISVKKAAEILGVTPREVYFLIHRGKLGYKKRGRVYVYEKEVRDRAKGKK